MSHIPSSAMKHAGPHHHEDGHPRHDRDAPHPHPRAGHGKPAADGIGTGAWLAIGGTLLVGAAAAIAVPLLKGRATPVPKRRGKRATVKHQAKRKPASK